MLQAPRPGSIGAVNVAVPRPVRMGLRPWPLVAMAVLVAGPVPAVPEVRGLRDVQTWALYYGALPGMAPALSRFDLVVLDPQRHPSIAAIKRRGARVLMYVSLGEINVHHRFYPMVAGSPCLLASNPRWPEARRLDLRDEACERWIREHLVPAAMATPGVDGLFLDTADSALGLERDDPGRFGGMAAALERVILAIRTAHPRVLLVMNGGLSLLPRVGPSLDGVAAESVWTDYDFAAGRYRRRDAADAEFRAASLEQARDQGLPVLTVEYLPPGQHDAIAEVLELARARQFVPYVSTIRLNRVFLYTLGPAPASRAGAH